MDDQGIFVTASYLCEPNYKLVGQAQLTCDTDTDEWQGDLPECASADGGSEPAGVASSQPEDAGANGEHPTENYTPPEGTDNAVAPHEPEIATTAYTTGESQGSVAVNSATGSPDPVPHPAEKVYSTPEDKRVDYEFASRLDNSCTTEGISAPAIDDSFVREYT